MRSLIENAVSYFAERAEAHHSTTTAGLHDAIVSGYSCRSTDSQQDLCQGSGDRRQVGILYAEVANYLHRTGQDEEGAHHRLVGSMKIIEGYVTAHNGSVAYTAGDAILVKFKDIESALRCAINVQLAARELNARLPVNRRVLFRIGVKSGDLLADNGDIYSDAINLAAWLEKLAHIGGICIPESVRSGLEDNSAFKFVALGKQYLKNICEPVQTFWIEFDAQQVVDEDFISSLKVSVMAS
jgi:class 3 adenylate cyclase